MAKYKYLSVRKPEEFRGVYYGDETIKHVRSRIQDKKGSSYKSFTENEMKTALIWANAYKVIKDIKDIKVKDTQYVTVVKNKNTNVTQNKDKKQQNIQANESTNTTSSENNYIREEYYETVNIPQIDTKSLSNKTEYINEICYDIEFLMNEALKDRYAIGIMLYLSEENCIKIHLKELYYYSDTTNRKFDISTGYGKDNMNLYFYKKQFNSSLGRHDYIFNEDLFKKSKHLIRKMERSNVKFLRNGLYIDQCNSMLKKTTQYESSFRYKNQYVAFSSIKNIAPFYGYSDFKSIITDPFVVEKCKENSL